MSAHLSEKSDKADHIDRSDQVAQCDRKVDSIVIKNIDNNNHPPVVIMQSEIHPSTIPSQLDTQRFSRDFLIHDDPNDGISIAKSESSVVRGINWDEGNLTTLTSWISDCNKQQFIYDSVLEKTIHKSKIIKIMLLVVGAIQSVVSFSNLGIDSSEDSALTWSIKIIISILSAIIYVLTQYSTLAKYEDTIRSYTSYNQTISSFLSTLVTTADMKIELRPDGDMFILENQQNYKNIFQKSPYIGRSDWKYGLQQYTKYIKNMDVGGDYRSRRRKLYDRYVCEAMHNDKYYNNSRHYEHNDYPSEAMDNHVRITTRTPDIRDVIITKRHDNIDIIQDNHNVHFTM